MVLTAPSAPDVAITDQAATHSPVTPTSTATVDKKGRTCTLRQRHCDTKPPSSTPPSSEHKQATAFDYNFTTQTGFYDCNICFDTAIYPVLTVCGHLFCWVCLSRWLEQQSTNPTCPMCKAGCSQDKIIPVYGRGREEEDPRCDASVPSRPSGKRPEPLHNPNIAGSSFFHPFRNNRPVETSALLNSRPPSNQANPSNGFFLRLMLMILSLFIVVVVFY